MWRRMMSKKLLSKPMENALITLGDAWFCLSIKSNTWDALIDRGLVRSASIELPTPRRTTQERCYVVGLTVEGMDQYHRLKGWLEEDGDAE
jgi:hypothetical protein